MKYKNKNGIELSFEGHKNDTSVQLIKEVLKEVIILGDKANQIMQHSKQAQWEMGSAFRALPRSFSVHLPSFSNSQLTQNLKIEIQKAKNI